MQLAIKPGILLIDKHAYLCLRLSLPEAFLAMDVLLRVAANVIDGIQVEETRKEKKKENRLATSHYFLYVSSGMAAGDQKTY